MGSIPTRTFPQLLGIAQHSFAGNPHRLHGRNLYYASAIGTAPEFAEIIVAQAENFAPRALDLPAAGADCLGLDARS